MKKIFIYAVPYKSMSGEYMALALCEDGTGLIADAAYDMEDAKRKLSADNPRAAAAYSAH